MTKARTVLSRLRRGDPAKKRQNKTLKTIALVLQRPARHRARPSGRRPTGIAARHLPAGGLRARVPGPPPAQPPVAAA
jgi:hypothetical protein